MWRAYVCVFVSMFRFVQLISVCTENLGIFVSKKFRFLCDFVACVDVRVLFAYKELCGYYAISWSFPFFLKKKRSSVYVHAVCLFKNNFHFILHDKAIRKTLTPDSNCNRWRRFPELCAAAPFLMHFRRFLLTSTQNTITNYNFHKQSSFSLDSYAFLWFDLKSIFNVLFVSCFVAVSLHSVCMMRCWTFVVQGISGILDCCCCNFSLLHFVAGDQPSLRVTFAKCVDNVIVKAWNGRF